jgi:hypothetical protein
MYIILSTIGPIIASHYRKPMEPQFRKFIPEFRSEQEERDAEAYQRKKRRGVVPPKKGAGKRAGKGKKKVEVKKEESSDGKAEVKKADNKEKA